jgi:broad specificity phosphatase PhoE
MLTPIRHGARLDQADKQWHLTSPTPYDPPLTYGGWTQARALGARIGGILRAREEEQEHLSSSAVDGNSSEHTGQKRKRKHQIIIHSSPFVRCVQTSIAIAAGIGQFKERLPSIAKHHVMHSGSPQVHAADHSAGLAAIPEPMEDFPSDLLLPAPTSTSLPEATIPHTHIHVGASPAKRYRIAELRLDAFLGEWLSPDYFENITPPPESVMMVASAKADLLRPGEAIEGATSGRRTHGNFPGGWSSDWSPASSADESEEKTGLANMAALGHALGHAFPNRTRSSTHGSDSPNSYSSRRHPTKSSINFVNSTPNNDSIYTPPTPTYAISSSDAIPVGYVAHARDACVDVSYQWDSMRAPQCWGNGGEYGEEWSSMHRRFRNGLSKMIEWYEEHGTAVNKAADMWDSNEEEKDTVLILVTHGAGCNALLGALTNQPVLLDVGMASLTMAVRKEGLAKSGAERREIEDTTNKSTPASARKNTRRGSIDLGIAENYEIKYTASTEHLRVGSNPLSASAISPRIGPSTSSSPYRRPATSFSGDSFTIGEGAASLSTGRPMTAGAMFSGSSGLHRSVSGHSGLRSSMYPGVGIAPKISSGLWRSGTSLSSNTNEGTPSESGWESDSLPNFGREIGGSSSRKASTAKTGTAVGNGNLDGANDDVTSGLTWDAEDDNIAPDAKVQAPSHTQSEKASLLNGNHLNIAVKPNETKNKAPSAGPMLPPPPPSPRIHMHTPTRTASQKGLWGGGGGGAGGAGGFTKETNSNVNANATAGMPKRRWTVLENSMG